MYIIQSFRYSDGEPSDMLVILDEKTGMNPTQTLYKTLAEAIAVRDELNASINSL